MRSIIVITGQTATGKTAYALKLAKKINADLISADSRQIYQYLDIVTGKDIPKISKLHFVKTSDFLLPTSHYLINNIKLWGLDIIKPDTPFSSSEYANYVNYLLDNIIPKDKPIIIIGGTYLYIKHLLYGIDTEGIKPDWRLRNKLNQLSVAQLQNFLHKKNPDIFNKMNHSDQNNPRRLIRKIEIQHRGLVYYKSKITAQIQHRGLVYYKTYNVNKFIGLKFKNNQIMQNAITQRVYNRINRGSIEETEKILKMGYNKKDPGLITIGYKQIIEYLNGNINKQEMINQWIIAETQYARRQFTFMKKDNNIRWQLKN